MKLIERLKIKSKILKRDTMALYLAYKNYKLPWHIKILSILVVGYALSPIDLIPDFIPILGYLDDLILIPAGIALLVKLIPPEIMQACREEAEKKFVNENPINKLAGIVILLIWIIMLATLIKSFLL